MNPKSTLSGFGYLNRIGVLLMVASVISATGCVVPPPKSPTAAGKAGALVPAKKTVPTGGPTQSDRLLKYYPDLHDGPFAVLADFEDPVHMEVVAVDGGASAQAIRNVTKGRKETGKACLEFHADSQSDELVLSDQSATRWHLRRNWRDYDLLLLSVWSPMEKLQLALSSTAGEGKDRATLVTRRPLQKGWNLLRMDLAELGEKLPLDDIRELRMAIAGTNKPVSVYFDDLLLAANRQDVFGNSGNNQGELFVRRSGRRWHVGSGGRFELTFAGGQIAAWHDLSRDPYRLRNLSRGTAIGPTPVPVDNETAEILDRSETPMPVEASIQWVEINAIRAVVTCLWRSAHNGGAAAPGMSSRTTYTIYATGHVFVEIESNADGRKSNEALGLAVCANTTDANHVTTGLPDAADVNAASFGAIQSSDDGASVYFVAVDHAGHALRVAAAHDAARKRGILLALPRETASAPGRWWAHLLFSTDASAAPEVLQHWADGFAMPSPPAVDIGSVAAAAAGKMAGGFDRANGCFQLVTDDGQLRWTAPAAHDDLSVKAYCVDAPVNASTWVYVNHLIHQPVVRTESGPLLFQLPRISGTKGLVEILWERNAVAQPKSKGNSK